VTRLLRFGWIVLAQLMLDYLQDRLFQRRVSGRLPAPEVLGPLVLSAYRGVPFSGFSRAGLLFLFGS
jgi:hypothetical protein